LLNHRTLRLGKHGDATAPNRRFGASGASSLPSKPARAKPLTVMCHGFPAYPLSAAERNQSEFSLNLEKPGAMIVERTNNDQIVITLSSSVDKFGLQQVIDYMKYLEATSKSKAKQADVDQLADEVNASWWAKNRKRFVK
jgi:hypothetical protein